MVTLRSRILSHAVAALLLPFALSSCGGGGGGSPAASTPTASSGVVPVGSSAPQTVDQIIASSYGSLPAQLSYATTVAAASTTLLQASVLDAVSAKQALIRFSAATNCTKLSLSESSPIQTDVMSLIFDTTERRDRLQDIYSKAGPFEIDPGTLQGGTSC